MAAVPEMITHKELPLTPNRESAGKGFDTQKEELFGRHLDWIERDRVFQGLARAIDNGWHHLDIDAKKQMLQLLNDVTESLRDYHNTYVILTKTSQKRESLNQKTYQQSVVYADQREHIAHHAFIDSLNILSRNMRTLGLDNAWRKDGEIYDVSEDGMIERTRNWMLKLFQEPIVQ